MSKKITIRDKAFKRFISSKEIERIITKMAGKINKDFCNQEVSFVSVLNGSFIFTADLIKQIKPTCSVSFIKCSSYEKMSSTGKVNLLIGLSENIGNKNVIILEDIIDTGKTIKYVTSHLKKYKPKNLKVATLFFKPFSYKENVSIDYVGMNLPNDFIVGYGLDYNGQGRNLRDVYILNNNSKS